MENYEEIGAIGRGSFGKVVKIKRKSDGKVLVWKELNYGQMNDKEKQQLVSEVNILRELRHPHIVRYYDRIIDKKKAKIFIIMEYCEGGDLASLLKKCRRDKDFIAEDVIWKIFMQIVLSLHECHNRKEGKILHRDLKPGNIFLDATNNVKLGDFGLSRIMGEESTFASTHVGTPYYMSPEQINESRYNEKSDIWSAGCLLYEMSALRPPFEAKNHMALAMKIKAGKIERLPSRYSEELQRVVLWMLTVNSNKRPSVEDLLNIPQISLRLREKKLRDTHVSLKKREEEAKSREKDLLEKEKSIQGKEEDINRQEEEIRRRHRELADKEQELDAKLEKLEEMERSMRSRPSIVSIAGSSTDHTSSFTRGSCLEDSSRDTEGESSGSFFKSEEKFPSKDSLEKNSFQERSLKRNEMAQYTGKSRDNSSNDSFDSQDFEQACVETKRRDSVTSGRYEVDNSRSNNDKAGPANYGRYEAEKKPSRVGRYEQSSPRYSEGLIKEPRLNEDAPRKEINSSHTLEAYRQSPSRRNYSSLEGRNESNGVMDRIQSRYDDVSIAEKDEYKEKTTNNDSSLRRSPGMSKKYPNPDPLKLSPSSRLYEHQRMSPSNRQRTVSNFDSHKTSPYRLQKDKPSPSKNRHHDGIRRMSPSHKHQQPLNDQHHQLHAPRPKSNYLNDLLNKNTTTPSSTTTRNDQISEFTENRHDDTVNSRVTQRNKPLPSSNSNNTDSYQQYLRRQYERLGHETTTSGRPSSSYGGDGSHEGRRLEGRNYSFNSLSRGGGDENGEDRYGVGGIGRSNSQERGGFGQRVNGSSGERVVLSNISNYSRENSPSLRRPSTSYTGSEKAAQNSKFMDDLLRKYSSDKGGYEQRPSSGYRR